MFYNKVYASRFRSKRPVRSVKEKLLSDADVDRWCSWDLKTSLRTRNVLIIKFFRSLRDCGIMSGFQFLVKGIGLVVKVLVWNELAVNKSRRMKSRRCENYFHPPENTFAFGSSCFSLPMLQPAYSDKTVNHHHWLCVLLLFVFSDFSFHLGVVAASAELSVMENLSGNGSTHFSDVTSFLFNGSRLRLNERHTNQLSIFRPFALLIPFRLWNEKCDVREFLAALFVLTTVVLARETAEIVAKVKSSITQLGVGFRDSKRAF